MENLTIDWQPFILSLKLAFATTSILLIISFPIVYAIQFTQNPWKSLWKSLISLPLVLPPSVLGYYLLVSFKPESFLGSSFENIFNAQLAFSFPGLVLGSVIFSLPFTLNPIISALETLPKSYQEAAFTLGKSKLATYTRILLPNVSNAIGAGAIMGFAHTLGEFGVVLMIGGSIPEETRVASIAIYDEVELMNYQQADVYALVLLSCSFFFLLLVQLVNYRKAR